MRALCERYEQFFAESEVIVPRVAAALAVGDLRAVGELVQRSHALTHSHLRNTVPETHWLPAAARELGAAAASAFGAGFGSESTQCSHSRHPPTPLDAALWG